MQASYSFDAYIKPGVQIKDIIVSKRTNKTELNLLIPPELIGERHGVQKRHEFGVQSVWSERCYVGFLWIFSRNLDFLDCGDNGERVEKSKK